MMLIQHSVNSDWLFNTQLRVLQADWFILEINEKATLNINLPCLGMTSMISSLGFISTILRSSQF